MTMHSISQSNVRSLNCQYRRGVLSSMKFSPHVVKLQSNRSRPRRHFTLEVRPPGMPIRRSLEHGGGAEEAVFVEGAGLDLQADGERGAGSFAAGEAARDADAGDAGEVGGDGVEIFQVHGERVP